MKFKLDENLGQRGAQRLAAAGHDVSTIVQQQIELSGRLWIVEPGRIRIHGSASD